MLFSSRLPWGIMNGQWRLRGNRRHHTATRMVTIRLDVTMYRHNWSYGGVWSGALRDTANIGHTWRKAVHKRVRQETSTWREVKELSYIKEQKWAAVPQRTWESRIIVKRDKLWMDSNISYLEELASFCWAGHSHLVLMDLLFLVIHSARTD